VQRRRRAVQARLDAVPASVSPWPADALVLPQYPHYGRYGDQVWRFGKQAPNRTDSTFNIHWAAGADAGWPTPQWAQVGRDLAMALLGRRPDRAAPAAGASKPTSVHAQVVSLAVIARWAQQNRLGLPDRWDDTVGPALLGDLRAGKLPRRRATSRDTGDSRARTYLEVLAHLWLHRDRIAHGPTAQPWPDFASTTATDLVTGGARPTRLPELATEVIDPPVWWALVRFALRFVLVYGPDILTAWPAYLQRRAHGRTRWPGPQRGPQTLAALQAFAADPANRVPVHADATPSIWSLSQRAGVGAEAFNPRNRYAQQCRDVVDDLIAAGRGTRFWLGDVADVPRADGSRGPWVDHLDTTNIVELAARLRDACYVLITALGALRDSETQGLRRGCVTVADGGYALTGEIVKGNPTPEPGRWWIDPLVARCVHTLERLGDHVPVTDLVAGQRVGCDRLFWTMGTGWWGRAGLGPGDRVLSVLIDWINDNAVAFDLPRAGTDPQAPAIPVQVNPHQLRVTFAAVAAMEPDGPLGVATQLHDTFAVASAYMANQDNKWFEVHRTHRDRVTVTRLRGYLAGGLDTLCGPGAAGLNADLHLATDDAVALAGGDDPAGLVEALLLAAGRTFGTSNLSHCRGRVADARCATAFTAIDPHTPFTPNFEADVCFGTTPGEDCGNVVYDPPDHLPVWDVALAAYRGELAALPEHRHLARVELHRLIAAAEQRIQAMEHACQIRPRQVLDRLWHDLERYLDYVRFDTDIPGAAAQYRHLYHATRRRVHWLRDKIPATDRPDWLLPADNHALTDPQEAR
jgi:hypothetical protein